MKNFDKENIDELLEIRQVCQYFPHQKICAIRYMREVYLCSIEEAIPICSPHTCLYVYRQVLCTWPEEFLKLNFHLLSYTLYTGSNCNVVSLQTLRTLNC